MEQLIDILQNYGMHTILLALCINVGTALLKIPVKALSKRLASDPNRINRFITLIPVLLGFLFAAVYTKVVFGTFWNGDTPVLALTSSSLSLAIYAILEKFFGFKGMTAEQRNETKKVIKETAEKLEIPLEATSEAQNDGEIAPVKIILKGSAVGSGERGGEKNDSSETK